MNDKSHHSSPTNKKTTQQQKQQSDRTLTSFNNTSQYAQKPPKKPVDYIKLLKSIKLEEDLRKLRNFKQIQRSMKKQKNEISQIEQQLQKVEQKIIQKKQQLMQKHIEQLQLKKEKRQEFIKQTNNELQIIKQKNEEKKKNIDEIVKELEQKEQIKYQMTLKERINRYRNPINFDQIKDHQKKYLQLKSSLQLKHSKITSNENQKDEDQKRKEQGKQKYKKSIRVKSQIGYTYQNQFQNLSIDHKSRLDQRIKDQYNESKVKDKKKKKEIIKLIQKRNEYGNKVENQKRNVRVKTQQSHPESKRQQESRIFWEKIKLENESKIHTKKPRLNTNLPKIDLKDYAKLSLRKISQSKSITPFQKIKRLSAIENLYMGKSNPEAFQMISQLSLIKADLLLKI